jgi:murein DD-endopeptidase MepM/ murein hydrolase activator NlpD
LRAGDKVTAGQQIGVVGVSGNAGDHGKLAKGGTPHVHFEIRFGKPVGLQNGGTVINPGYFLPQDYNVLDFWPFDPRERTRG